MVTYILCPGRVRRLSHGGVGSAEGSDLQRCDPGGGRRDGGLPGEAVRGAAGGHGRLLRPAEEPLCSGSPEGEGEGTEAGFIR